MNEWIAEGARMIDAAKKILVFTGAGISTESGIPDFRSPGGIWEKYDPSDFYFQKFISDENARVKYWQMSTEFYGVIRDARPNRAHLAIKALEDKGKLLAVVTQNIDNLHRTAGSSNVIEYHGNVTLLRCMECNTRDKRTAHGRILEEKGVPPCPSCDAPMKSDVVHFGEPIPHDVAKKSQEEMFKADMLLICGTSAVVHPFASLPELARYYRKDAVTMVEVNLSDTPLSHMVEYPVRASTSEVLSAIASRLI